METPIPYSIQRTRNRTSRAVLRDGTITIRLARGLSEREERRHVEHLLRRMAKAAARERERTVIDPFRPLLQGADAHSVTLLTGSTVDFAVVDAPVKRTRAVRHPNGWRIERGTEHDPLTMHRFLWRLLSMHAAGETEALVRRVNAETFREDVRRVSLKFMRSRWGSCSLGGTITIAAPLLCTSEDILRYVVVHELAHLRHPDHSRRFWSAVEEHEPGYRKALLSLKNMRLPRD